MKSTQKIFKSVSLIIISFSFQFSFAQNWDINIVKNINPQNPNSVFWRTTTNSSYPLSIGIPVAIWVAGEVSKNKNLEHKAYQIAGSVVIAAVATEGLKIIINRERPYEKYNFIYPYDATDKGQSFPSAHTSLAFATATSLSLQYKKWYIIVPAYAWAASVGYSRLYLGEHYTTDVIGGAVIGAGSAFASNWLSKKIFRK
ncbi:MAG: phosphatase PAP2 family protein [Chitinophagaceae bacterium]